MIVEYTTYGLDQRHSCWLRSPRHEFLGEVGVLSKRGLAECYDSDSLLVAHLLKGHFQKIRDITKELPKELNQLLI